MKKCVMILMLIAAFAFVASIQAEPLKRKIIGEIKPDDIKIEEPKKEDLAAQIKKLKEERIELSKKIAELEKELPKAKAKDYELPNEEGKNVKISSLFGDKEYLIAVNNMGKECFFCTLYANSLKAVLGDFEKIAGFCVVSIDDAKVLKETKEKQGWNFNLLSGKGSDYFKDLGFDGKDGGVEPGIVVFHKNADGSIDVERKLNYFRGDFIGSVVDMYFMIPQKQPEGEDGSEEGKK